MTGEQSCLLGPSSWVSVNLHYPLGWPGRDNQGHIAAFTKDALGPGKLETTCRRSGVLCAGERVCLIVPVLGCGQPAKPWPCQPGCDKQSRQQPCGACCGPGRAGDQVSAQQRVTRRGRALLLLLQARLKLVRNQFSARCLLSGAQAVASVACVGNRWAPAPWVGSWARFQQASATRNAELAQLASSAFCTDNGLMLCPRPPPGLAQCLNNAPVHKALHARCVSFGPHAMWCLLPVATAVAEVCRANVSIQLHLLADLGMGLSLLMPPAALQL